MLAREIQQVGKKRGPPPASRSAGTSGAVKLAEKIRRDLEGQVFQTDRGELKCTISMGVATLPIHARTQEDLVKRADTALYAAKEGGRNQVRVWEKSLGD